MFTSGRKRQILYQGCFLGAEFIRIARQLIRPMVFPQNVTIQNGRHTKVQKIESFSNKSKYRPVVPQIEGNCF